MQKPTQDSDAGLRIQMQKQCLEELILSTTPPATTPRCSTHDVLNESAGRLWLLGQLVLKAEKLNLRYVKCCIHL